MDIDGLVERLNDERLTGNEALRAKAAAELSRLQSEVEALRVALGRLRTSAAMLQQHSEACAINHYGEDFGLHGMPGWLADTKKDIADALALLPTKDPGSVHR